MSSSLQSPSGSLEKPAVRRPSQPGVPTHVPGTRHCLPLGYPDCELTLICRPLRVRFDCNVSGDLPWRFRPCQRAMTIVPGQSVLAFYTVTNTTDQDVIGVSTYNVVPFKAGPYFNKVQCFW